MLSKIKLNHKVKAKKPVWRGPEVDGITQSLLSRFLSCRERFRLQVIEGWTTQDGFSHFIEYGQMWHTCEEALAKKVDWQEPLKQYCIGLCKTYKLDQQKVDHWYRVCKVQFPEYIKYWAKNKDVVDRTPLFQEQTFKVPYILPSGRTVLLRGKWDSVDIIGKGKNARVYLQENKTKGDIDERKMTRNLTFDLQTMLYLTAIQFYQKNVHRINAPILQKFAATPLGGIRYNVIRRPLSGGKGSIKQKQNESINEYYERLAQYIKDEPETYFMRWKVEVTQGDIDRFRKECLDPILEQLCSWYEWVTKGDPWRNYYDDEDVTLQIGSGIHYRHPFGVTNPIDEWGSSDIDEYMATGSTVGLERVTSLFGELE